MGCKSQVIYPVLQRLHYIDWFDRCLLSYILWNNWHNQSCKLSIVQLKSQSGSDHISNIDYELFDAMQMQESSKKSKLYWE